MGVAEQREEEEQEGLSTPGRIAAAAALVLALAAVGWILFRGGDDYTVKVRFQAATQVVKGNLVQIGGRKVGLVDSIRLTDDGQAELELKLEPEHAPLRRGTQATLRIASLS